MKQAMADAVLYEISKEEKTVSMEEFFVNEIKRIKRDLFRVANSILQNYADAEDALSESIVMAYSKLSSLKSKEKFKFWMMKILVRECYSLRRAGRKLVCTDKLPDAVAAPETPANEFWDVVLHLPDEFRIVVVLFYYEDMSLRDITKLLHISEGTVKSRLFRAKEKLRGFLNQELGRESE